MGSDSTGALVVACAQGIEDGADDEGCRSKDRPGEFLARRATE
jgi:hypothetical protein